MGGSGNYYKTSAFFIDGPSNTWHLSGNMPKPLVGACSDVVDGKIYVVGKGTFMVFDTETKKWEELGVGTRPDLEMRTGCNRCVASSGKIYVPTGDKNTCIYDPKDCKWEMDEILNSKYWEHACVVDDVLYSHGIIDNKLIAYDLKEKSWKVVKGVEGMLHGNWSWSCMTSHCGKLVLFLQKSAGLKEKKEIWGLFEWCNIVLSEYDDYLDDCRAVTV